VVSFKEIDVLHRITKAINAEPELATAALVKVTIESNAKVNFD